MLSAIVVGDHLQHAACGDAIEHVSARNVVGVVSLVEMGCRRKSEQSNGNSNKVSTIAGAAKLTVGRWLCVPKIRFGVDAASGRRKLAS
jgi:hypothetical protein